MSISGYSSLIPLIFLILFFKKDRKFLFPYYLLVIISVIIEIINHLLVANQVNNFFVCRIFTPIELLLISLFYVMFYKDYFRSIFLLIPIPLFIVVAFVDYKVNGIANFDNYATSFEAIVFSIISLWSFYYLVKKMIFESVPSEPFFWINTAVLLYFGGNLILFVFNDYLVSNIGSGHHAMWTIHSVLNIFYNILIAIGFWKTKRQ